MDDDVFKTVEEEGTGQTEKKSNSFLMPCMWKQKKAKAVLDEYRKNMPTLAFAGHMCWDGTH